MEERGWDTTPTAGGVYELLRDVSEVVPGVLELELEELLVGLRPATPDNLPALGAGALDGLFWATGHYRNGILLSGLSGELAAAALCGEPLPAWAAAADPAPLRAGAGMTVVVNGEPRELAPGTTVSDLLAVLELPGDGRGVAVAVDAEVVPRGQWETTQIDEGARVEVLRAIQGG